VIVATVAVGLAASTGAVAAQDTTAVTECKAIEEPGEYVLDEDVGGDTETCIEIASSDVTFDGQGNSIAGVGDENSTGISVESGLETVTDVTVTDVEVTDWGEGITLSIVEDTTVTDVEVTGSGSAAVTIADSSNNVVENSRLAENTDGVSVVGFFGEASDNEIRNNVIEDNEENGVTSFLGVNGSMVENNEIRNNDGAGFLAALAQDIRFADNTVTGNDVGYIASVTEDNTASGNEMSQNTVGIATTFAFGESFSTTQLAAARWAFSSPTPPRTDSLTPR